MYFYIYNLFEILISTEGLSKPQLTRFPADKILYGLIHTENAKYLL